MSRNNFDNSASSDEDLTPSPPSTNIELNSFAVNEFVNVSSRFEHFLNPNVLFASAEDVDDLINSGEVPGLFSSGTDDFPLDPALRQDLPLSYNVVKNTPLFQPPAPPTPETHAGLRHFPFSPSTYAMPETGLGRALRLLDPTAPNPLTMPQTGFNCNMNEDAYRALCRARLAESSLSSVAPSAIAGPSNDPYASQPKRAPRAASSRTVARSPRNAVASSSRSESPESPVVPAARKQAPLRKRKADDPEDKEEGGSAASSKKRRFTKEEERKFPCSECSFVCFSPRDLLRHMQSRAHSEPSHFCAQCGYAFTREDALKRHLLIKPKSHKTVGRKGKDR